MHLNGQLCVSVGLPPRCRLRCIVPLHGSYSERISHTNILRRIDDEKENARQKRRTIFSSTDWKRHRSSTRFIRHLSTIVESGVIKGVLVHVALVIALAALVAAWNCASISGLLPPWIAKPPSIAIEPIQLTSFALSLLLVFRTNAAYSRWTEARQKVRIGL